MVAWSGGEDIGCLRAREIELDGLKASNPARTRLSSRECFDLLGLVSRDQNPPKIYPAASDVIG